MSKFCTKCGSELKPDEKFCTKCGAKVNDAPKPNAGEVLSASMKKYLPFALGAVVVLVGALLYFMFAPSGPSKDDVEKVLLHNVAGQSAGSSESFRIKDIKINDTAVDKEETVAKLSCMVVLEGETLKSTRYYDLSFMKTKDRRWEGVSCSPVRTQEWLTTPKGGVTADIIKKSLIGTTVKTKNGELHLTKQNLDDIKITEQKTNLEKGSDEVKFAYKISAKAAYIQEKADAIYVFKHRGWEISSIVHDDDPKLELNKEHEFKRSDEEIKNDIINSPLIWKSSFGKQTIKITAETMKNFQKEPFTFIWSEGWVCHKCEFDIVKPVATLHIVANACYEYGVDGWKIASMKYDPKVDSVSLQGLWKGHFPDGDGRPNLDINIETQDANGMVTAICNFAPSGSAPGYPSGSFSMVGGLDKKTLEVKLKRNNWINRPKHGHMFNLEGVLLVDEGKIADRRQEFMIEKVTK